MKTKNKTLKKSIFFLLIISYYVAMEIKVNEKKKIIKIKNTQEMQKEKKN